MAEHSSIEWTEATWNPVTGCTKVSPGCDNCYAERLAGRLLAMGNPRYRNGFEVTLHEDQLTLPLRWQRPKLVFVNSMSDLFHPKLPTGFIQQVFAVMAQGERHTFQVLTKRPKRVAALAAALPWPDNVWIGTSIETQYYVGRADDLRRADQAAVRFLSLEPLLGPLELDLVDIGWVIAGGESGPNARAPRPEWVRSIRDQCVAARVPFLLSSGAAGRRRPAAVPLTAKFGARCRWGEPMPPVFEEMNGDPIAINGATRCLRLYRLGEESIKGFVVREAELRCLLKDLGLSLSFRCYQDRYLGCRGIRIITMVVFALSSMPLGGGRSATVGDFASGLWFERLPAFASEVVGGSGAVLSVATIDWVPGVEIRLANNSTAQLAARTARLMKHEYRISFMDAFLTEAMAVGADPKLTLEQVFVHQTIGHRWRWIEVAELTAGWLRAES